MTGEELIELREQVNRLELQLCRLESLMEKTMGKPSSPVCGISEACRMLGIGRTKMMEKLSAGELDFAFKRDGKWRFEKSKLQRAAFKV